jgi:esterase/lipase superfamily enzyme
MIRFSREAAMQRWLAPLTTLLLFLPTTGVSSQPDAIRVGVPAGSTVRSGPIEVRTGDAIVIRTSGEVAPGRPVIRFFVHRTDGTLVGLDDPERATDVTTLSVAPGSYYVIFRNTGDAEGMATLGTDEVRATPTQADLAVVRVFYATDRKRALSSPLSFTTEPDTTLSYGHSDVTIPRAAHEMGELEGPSIWRLEFSPDPAKHIVMGPLVDASDRLFFSQVREGVQKSPKHECLIFVHGFNVPFEDAIRRTAQIRYDIAFDGVPILFSWPSQGSPLPGNYRKDERNAALSADSLHRFLLSLASGVPGVTVHIITHSMGSRVVAGALEQISAEAHAAGLKPLGEVALLAPDIDAELFRRAGAKLTGAAARVTLYASDKDGALILSEHNAGYKRAGQAGPDLVIVPGMDTIDASQVDTGILGLRHLYYADNSTILSDLFHVLRGRSPRDRNPRLEMVGTPPKMYWRFRPATK